MSKKIERTRAGAAALDRLPPHAAESEQGVVGCVLLEPSRCLDELAEAGFKPEWCYDLRHAAVVDTAAIMHREGRFVDLITLSEELRERDLLDQVGGIAYLNECQDRVPSAANLEAYLAKVKEKWQLRKLIQLCTGCVGRIYDFEGDVEELFAELEKEFSTIAQASTPASEQRIKPILLDQVIPDLEGHYARGRAQIVGLTTGLEYLDKIFCGFGGDKGNYHMLAARPNVGKTSLLTQIMMHLALDFVEWVEVPAAEVPDRRLAGENIAERETENEPTRYFRRVQGLPVAISSLEMGAAALVKKMLFQRGGADLQRWRTGYANKEDMVLLFQASTALGAKNNIIIDETPRVAIAQLKAKWRRWHRQYGVRAFGLDYLQLMQGSQKRFRPDRVQELAEVSAEIQALGKELNCPMFILGQMNRDYEKDPNRAPRMSDLKDCGAVEQDADTLTFLYAPRQSDAQEEFFEKAMLAKFGEGWKKWDGRPERINALVAKNRFGPKGKAELLLLHSSTVFKDWIAWLKGNQLKAASTGETGRCQNEELGMENEE